MRNIIARLAATLALCLSALPTLDAQTRNTCAAMLNPVACLVTEYRRADSVLNVTYAETMRVIGPANASELRKLQREWVNDKIDQERRLLADSVALLRYQIEASNERTDFLSRYQPTGATYAPSSPSLTDATTGCWPEELTRRYFVWRDDATEVQFSREQIANCTFRVRYSFSDDPLKPVTDRDFVAVLRLGDRARYLKVLSQGSGWTPWGLELPENCGATCDLPLSEAAAYALPLEPDERYTELRPDASVRREDISTDTVEAVNASQHSSARAKPEEATAGEPQGAPVPNGSTFILMIAIPILVIGALIWRLKAKREPTSTPTKKQTSQKSYSPERKPEDEVQGSIESSAVVTDLSKVGFANTIVGQTVIFIVLFAALVFFTRGFSGLTGATGEGCGSAMRCMNAADALFESRDVTRIPIEDWKRMGAMYRVACKGNIVGACEKADLAKQMEESF